MYSDNTKTATSNRVLPLTANMRAYLQTVKAQQEENKKLFGDAYLDSGYVCVHPNGSPIRPDYVTPHFRRKLKEAGLPAIRFHDLRHFYATAALERDESYKTLQETLGHSTITTTMDIYAHVTQKGWQQSADKTEQYIQKVLGGTG